MRLSIESLRADSLALWHAPYFSPPESRFSVREQSEREAEVDRLMREADLNSPDIGRESVRRTDVRSRIQRAVVELLHSFDCPIDDSLQTEFSGVLDEFIRQAEDFDPSISDEAVYQASRNALIMHSFQMYFDKKVRLTPSIFAYSALYPYTDNYLDSDDVDVSLKKSANDWLHLRLGGFPCEIRNDHEQKIDSLVRMIEGEFDRRDYPGVFESVLAIHRAQMRSVDQCGGAVLSPTRLLDISIEKGGTSVLADGYLVAGDLSAEVSRFFFRFGVLLQLIDDLQDVEEDFSHNQQTVAGLLAVRGSLGHFVSRLIAFLSEIVPHKSGVTPPERRLHELIDRSCRLLIFEAVAMHDGLFDEEFLRSLDRQSPVRLAYLREIRGSLSRRCPPSLPRNSDKLLERAQAVRSTVLVPA